MIAPVLRLLATYLFVGLAVFAFFQRDALRGLFGHERAGAVTVSSPAPSEAHQAKPAPVAAPARTPALQAPQPPANPQPASPQPATAQPAQASAPSADERHYEARRVYWDADPEQAIALYIELLKADPESLELNGELGNIYYMRGEYPKAATYYGRAGKAAAKAGNRAQVLQLVSILRSLDPEAAKALEAGLGARP